MLSEVTYGRARSASGCGFGNTKRRVLNLAIISHQPDEFFIDFLLVDPQAQTPERGQALLVARVILSRGT